MRVPSKVYNIQLVQIQPGERLATTPELNPARRVVTVCCEARGTGYWAATQVKVLSPEIYHVSEADVFYLTEGSILTVVISRQDDECPTGSEAVARYQTDIIGPWEAQGVLPLEVCAIKPMNGKMVQTTFWESDQPIVPMKQGNACGGKGLAGMRPACVRRTGRCDDGGTSPPPRGG